MTHDKSVEIYNACLQLIDEGKAKEALTLADSITVLPLRAAILIDGGTSLGQSGKVREGTKIFEDLLSLDESEVQFTRYSLLYNAANGYSEIYTLRRIRRKNTVPANDEDLRIAKRLYREALADLGKMEMQFASTLWINYGNCLSSLGRHIEAVACYKKALVADPTSGMASGNLGIELEHVANIMGRYRHEYLALAHSALAYTFGQGIHFTYGSDRAIQSFRNALERLQLIVDAHNEPILPPKPLEANFDEQFLSEYVRFNLDNGLFLNAWVGDEELSPGITDELSFGPIVTEINDEYLVPELLRILNEIKESFATSRYLLFLSQKESPILDRISKFTIYFNGSDTLDVNGLYSGLCKTAYSRAFDALDKVARIINIYFKIGNRDSSFWNMFVEKQSLGEERTTRFAIRPSIVSSKNFSLYALADLCLDYFESNHLDLKAIDRRRNRITHDYLNVRLFLLEHEKLEDGLVSLGTLKKQTIEVLKLVRLATLYAVSAVNMAESFKKSNGKLLTIEYPSSTGQPWI